MNHRLLLQNILSSEFVPEDFRKCLIKKNPVYFIITLIQTCPDDFLKRLLLFSSCYSFKIGLNRIKIGKKMTVRRFKNANQSPV